MEDIISKAYEFAKTKHAGVLDDNGVDFFLAHPQHVAEILKIVVPYDDNLIAAGFLHDTIEDTNTTYEELLKEFNQDIADLVMEVTQEGQKDSHGYFFPRLKSERGIILKFADRMSNLSRMKAWPQQRKNHYLRKSKFWRSE